MRWSSDMSREEIRSVLTELASRVWGPERRQAQSGSIEQAAFALWTVLQVPLSPLSEEPDLPVLVSRAGGGQVMELHELTASAAVRAMCDGEISPVEMVQALLARIESTELQVQAWEALDAEGALATAKLLESRRRERHSLGILYGLPVGLKDVFHVRGLPTTANFEPYRGQVAGEDSGVAQHLREAGAIILGKTVTVQFASGPGSPKTRNPWNLNLSPGGSSSGSGAAVGARHVPAAIGTQTGGSTLRPAAFCGVVGFKPTFGRISRYGLFPVSWTLDHPAVIARSVADAALLLQALARHDERDPYSARQGTEDFVAAASAPSHPPRLGLVLDLVERAEPPVREAALAASQRLANAGAEVREVRLPFDVDLILSVWYLICVPEQAAVQAEQHARLADYYYPKLRADIEVGQLLPAAAHLQAKRLQRRLREKMADMVGSFDALIAPTAPSLPKDPSMGTGDPSFQKVWTLFGFPIVSVPTMLSSDRLPHGIQIVGGLFREQHLLQVASWCESVLGPMEAPF